MIQNKLLLGLTVLLVSASPLHAGEPLQAEIALKEAQQDLRAEKNEQAVARYQKLIQEERSSANPNSSIIRKAQRGVIIGLLQSGKYDEATKFLQQEKNLPNDEFEVKRTEELIEVYKQSAPDRRSIRTAVGRYLQAVSTRDAGSYEKVLSPKYSVEKRRRVMAAIKSGSTPILELAKFDLTLEGNHAKVRVEIKPTAQSNSERVIFFELEKSGGLWKITRD